MLALTNTQVVALIAAGSALLGSLLTGSVQFFIERYRRGEDRKDREVERNEEQREQQREHRRDLYLRYLRFLTLLPITLKNTFFNFQDFEEQLVEFRTELRFYGSPEMNRFPNEVTEAFSRYTKRVRELRGADVNDPQVQAYNETMGPVIERE
jgi:hypothetical protein